MSTLATASLAECEAVIERGLRSFVAVGEALTRIRDERLYAGFATFEDYCCERWGLSRPHAYRLMDATEVVSLVSPDGDTTAPRTEAVARELAPLRSTPAELREAWTEVVDQHGPAPTAVQVREVVQERRPDTVGDALKRIVPCDNRFEYVNQCAIWLRNLPDPTDLPLPPDEGNQQRLAESIRFLAEWAPRMVSAWERRNRSEEAA